jgi:hypothetical protein
LLEDLFGGDNEETMFPSMLNVEYTQGRWVSTNGQPWALFQIAMSIDESAAENPVSVYTVPDSVWCLIKVEVFNWAEVEVKLKSTWERVDWESGDNSNDTCIEVSKVKTIMYYSQAWVTPNFSQISQRLYFSGTEVWACLEVLFSADNAQYVETEACYTVCGDWTINYDVNADGTWWVDECDDWNLINWDWCDDTCQIESPLAIDVITEHNINYLNYTTSISDNSDWASGRVFASSVPDSTCLIIGTQAWGDKFGDDEEFLDLSYDNW